MTWQLLENLLLEALALFAGGLTSPFTVTAVLVAAVLCRGIGSLRASGVAAGAAWGLFEALTATGHAHPVVALGACSAAGLLQAELLIAVVLPAWRFARHVARRIAEELAALWR